MEWSLSRVLGTEELQTPETGLHAAAVRIQSKTAILPDYGFKTDAKEAEEKPGWLGANAGTTVSGLVGGALTLAMTVLIGFILKRRTKTAGTG